MNMNMNKTWLTIYNKRNAILLTTLFSLCKMNTVINVLTISKKPVAEISSAENGVATT